jgi:hypothetical protein
MSAKRWSCLVAVVLVSLIVGIFNTALVSGQVFNPYVIPPVARPTIIIGDPGGSPAAGGFTVVTVDGVLYFQWKITNEGDQAVTVCPYANLYGVAHSPAPFIGYVCACCITCQPHQTVTVRSVLSSAQWCYPNILVKTACVNARVEWSGISYLAYPSDQCIIYPGNGFSLYPSGAPPGTPTTPAVCPNPSTCPQCSGSTSPVPSAPSSVMASTPGIPEFSLLGVGVAALLVGAIYVSRRTR